MKDITTYLNEMASGYVSKSGRTGNDNFDGEIYDVIPDGIEQDKAKKLIWHDTLNDVAFEKFLKLSNKKFKVCNRTLATLQHIKNNGGNIRDVVNAMRAHWKGYFTFEEIFGSDDPDEITKELDKVLD